ncbi:MAG: replication protein [Chloroflexota bacterium]|nr:replication protein [Chloroflexota bacterium]
MTRDQSTPTTFDGFASPNFTQVPDELFDILMPQLSDAELRVLLYIVRRTFGFKRDRDAISLSQMVSGITTREGQVLDRGTGLSKATVARGLAGLRAKGVILAERCSSAQRGNEATTYRLRFKAASSGMDQLPTPLSQRRDKAHSAPRVSAVRHALSHQRDTQNTGGKNTDFDISKEIALRDEREAGEPRVDPNPAPSEQSKPVGGMESLAAVVRRRRVKPAGGEDRLAIAATIARLAPELGDTASPKASTTRAMNLFQLSGVGCDAFLDLLFQASAEVRDRRRDPGKAPLPRNRMAYFFAVVEDRLGLREDVLSGNTP